MTTENDEAKCGRWTKYSENKLIELENKILHVVKTAYKTCFVPIGSTVGTEDKIWTISLNQESKKTPLVLLHGFAAGLGFWCLNLDHFSKDRPVYAIDLLGFGRSTRPCFSKDSDKAEEQMVDSIEAWRKQMNLEKFILLGHSFGGYLATSYSIKYPDRVKHLILADPWGFSEKPANFKPPLWFKTLGILLYPFTYLNPLATVRAAGPAGPWLVRKMRQDIVEKYGGVLEDKEVISEYIYQCNSQKPTGETAFHSMLKGFGWSKNPMVNRFDKIKKDLPITVIYGEDSWINQSPGHVLKETRFESYVNVEIIEGAGHHIHADQPLSFNEVVVEACLISDTSRDTSPTKDRPKSTILNKACSIPEKKETEECDEETVPDTVTMESNIDVDKQNK